MQSIISPNTVIAARSLALFVATALAGLIASGPVQAAETVTGQGNSISFSDVQTSGGMRMIMGAEQSDGWLGAAVFFKRNQSTGGWTQVKKVAEGTAGQYTTFGKSVSMSGDGNWAIVGAPHAADNVGIAYLYQFSNNTWRKAAALSGRNAVGTSQQGESVFISYDGKTAFVGGKEDNDGVGAVWVYVQTNGKWKQQAKLSPAGATGYISFGSAVSSTWDGNRVVIGGPGDNNGIGASWIFERKDGKWSQAGEKIVATGGTGDYEAQGRSVAMTKDGDLFVTGSPDDATTRGSATIFVRSKSGEWKQKTRLQAPSVNSSLFGRTVAVSARGGMIIVGEPNILNGTSFGQVSSYAGTPDTSYTAQPILSNTPCGYAGESVAISPSADFLFVGGTGTPPGDPVRGGACFYTKESGKWKIKASPVAYK